MIYRNTKTGVILDSPCDISGGDWVKDGKEIKKADKKTDPTPEKKEEEKDIDLQSMTLADLKDLAEEKGVDLGDAKKKDEIVAVLTSAT